MVLVLAMENVVTHTCLCSTQDYLTQGICSLIKPAALVQMMQFPAKIYTVML